MDDHKKSATEKTLLLIDEHKKGGERPKAVEMAKDGYLNDDDFISDKKPVEKTKEKRSFLHFPTPYLSINILIWVVFLGVDLTLGFLVYLFYPF